MKEGHYRKYRRRNFFIKRHLQGRFVAGFSAAVSAGIALNLLVAYYLIDARLTEELYRIHLKTQTIAELAWPALWKLSLATAGAGFLVAAAIGYHLTRRVEAPVADLIEGLRRAAGADFSKRLMHAGLNGMEDLRAFFNRMAHSLGKRLHIILDCAVEMEKNCERVSRIAARRELSMSELEEMKRELMAVCAVESKIRQELTRFKV